MATSGTYNFANSPAAALTQISFGRIRIRRTALTTEHLADAATESNLIQVTIAGNQPNLWKSTIIPIPLVAGTAVYNLPTNMVAVQDVFLTTSIFNSTVDRVLYAVSLFEYDAQAQKTIQAPPTLYMVQKTLQPTITLWQVPDSAATYTLNVRYLQASQDVVQSGGLSLDLPLIYMDAYVAGLAHRMSRIWAPDLETVRKADWDEALAIAQRTDTQDNTQLIIQPDLSGYQRMR